MNNPLDDITVHFESYNIYVVKFPKQSIYDITMSIHVDKNSIHLMTTKKYSYIEEKSPFPTISAEDMKYINGWRRTITLDEHVELKSIEFDFNESSIDELEVINHGNIELMCNKINFANKMKYIGKVYTRLCFSKILHLSLIDTNTINILETQVYELTIDQVCSVYLTNSEISEIGKGTLDVIVLYNSSISFSGSGTFYQNVKFANDRNNDMTCHFNDIRFKNLTTNTTITVFQGKKREKINRLRFTDEMVNYFIGVLI